jgi:hypothetical protein
MFQLALMQFLVEQEKRTADGMEQQQTHVQSPYIYEIGAVQAAKPSSDLCPKYTFYT